MKDIKNSKFYVVGGGIASLASAAYLIREGHVDGNNIYIFESSEEFGGSMCSGGSAKEGYFCRGFRMFEDKVYSSTFDLFSFIPSVDDPNKTIMDTFSEFNHNIPICSKARLIEKGNIIDADSFGLNWRDKSNLLELRELSEDSIENKEIRDHFTPSFFKTNFWFEFCTTFAFQPWHSLIEMQRYLFRFLHDSPLLSTMACVRSGQYNEHDFIILPVMKWLREKRVNFVASTIVTDIGISISGGDKIAVSIDYTKEGKQHQIKVGKNDFVFTTIGSMTEGSSIGSMDAPPEFMPTRSNPSWDLWEKIARSDSDFGNPAIFKRSIDRSKWESFTITSTDQNFFKFIEEITGNEIGTGGIITFKNSGWLISLSFPSQPYFRGQPKDTVVCWGYALMPDNEGDFVEKRMTECSGKEILFEILSQFGLQKETDSIISNSICRPCLMPYITSQFLPRAKSDRPNVVPKGVTNFAFLGQFVEIKDEIVFTVECSVRSAQMAVYSLLNIEKEIPPIYQGKHDPRVIYGMVKRLLL